MELFKYDKKPCPICGEPTPKIFPSKIENQSLCKECSDKISMEDHLKNLLTLDTLQKHLAYREKNAELHKNFTETRSASTGLFGRTICIDDSQQLWYIKGCGNEPIFRFHELVRYTLLEDNHIIERGSLGGRKTNPSIVMDGVLGELKHQHTRNNRRGSYASLEEKIEAPVQTIWLEIEVDNIYWNKRKLRFNAPDVVDNDITRYVMDYTINLTKIRELTQAITSFFQNE
jgi:hypothetical protein